jgi:hypothetical protein
MQRQSVVLQVTLHSSPSSSLKRALRQSKTRVGFMILARIISPRDCLHSNGGENCKPANSFLMDAASCKICSRVGIIEQIL